MGRGVSFQKGIIQGEKSKSRELTLFTTVTTQSQGPEKRMFVLLPELGGEGREKGFPGGSVVKNPPANAVRSLGWEDLLAKEMATCSSILAWRISWTEEPGGLQFMRLKRVKRDLATKQQQSRGKEQ